MALVTVGRAQLHPQCQKIDAVLLADLLEAASKMAESFCNRSFTAADFAEVRDGNGLVEMAVCNPPINTLTSVVLLLNDESTETLLTAEFRFDSESGLVQPIPTSTMSSVNGVGSRCFPYGFKNITFNYNGGYATIPDDLQEAVIQIAVALNAMRSLNSYNDPGMVSETLGDYSYKRGEVFNALDGLTLEILSSYRI